MGALSNFRVGDENESGCVDYVTARNILACVLHSIRVTHKVSLSCFVLRNRLFKYGEKTEVYIDECGVWRREPDANDWVNEVSLPIGPSLSLLADQCSSNLVIERLLTIRGAELTVRPRTRAENPFFDS